MAHLKTKTQVAKELDDFKKPRGHWELKQEALDRSLWRTRFGRGYGPVVRQDCGKMTCNSKTGSILTLR